MASFGEIANKKVLGVKALYLIGAFVVILAIVAWKMKPGTTGDTTDQTDPSNSTASEDQQSDSSLYSGLGATSTGQLNTGSTDTSGVDAPIPSNDSWANDAVKWITQHESGATGTNALRAVSKFMEGADLSITEDKWISDYIKVAGPPPDGVTVGGVIQPPASPPTTLPVVTPAPKPTTPPVPKPAPPKSPPKPTRVYTVKTGDTLYKIAAKLGVSESLLYQNNKAVIEDAARKHGHANSNGGNLIFAGTVLHY
jgi:LysM repeat protein